MKNLRIKITLTGLMLAAGLCLNAQNRSIRFEEGSWRDILAKSAAEKKPVFLDAYTSWCGPCKWMSKNIFTNDTVADYYNGNFICAKIDMEKGEGVEIAKKYDVRAYPTLLFIGQNGEVLHRLCGSREAAVFVQDGKNAFDNSLNYAGYRKKFEGGNMDPSFLGGYISYLSNACMPCDDILNAYFRTQKPEALTSRANWEMIKSFSRRVESPEFIYLETHLNDFSALYTRDSVGEKITDVYYDNMMTALHKKDSASYFHFREKLRSSGLQQAEKTMLYADMSYFSANGQWNKYAGAAELYIAKYGMNEWQLLNGVAWNFYEHLEDNTNLQKAMRWVNKSIQLSDNYFNNDTRASLLYKLGRKDEAMKAAEAAIALAKKSGDDYKSTEDLLAKIREMK